MSDAGTGFLTSAPVDQWVDGSMGRQAEWLLRMWRLREVGEEGLLGLSGVKRNRLCAAKHNVELLTGLPSLLGLLYLMPPPPNAPRPGEYSPTPVKGPVGTVGERLNLHKSECLTQVRF